MYFDIWNGVELTPSKNGEKCLGNGECKDEEGNPIECSCDECDYLGYCFEDYLPFDMKPKE